MLELTELHFHSIGLGFIIWDFSQYIPGKLVMALPAGEPRCHFTNLFSQILMNLNMHLLKPEVPFLELLFSKIPEIPKDVVKYW